MSRYRGLVGTVNKRRSEARAGLSYYIYSVEVAVSIILTSSVSLS